MDPDENLRKQREAAAEIIELIDDADAENGGDLDADAEDRILSLAEDLAEHVQALDGWLKSFGFLPKDWTRRHAKSNGFRKNEEVEDMLKFLTKMAKDWEDNGPLGRTVSDPSERAHCREMFERQAEMLRWVLGEDIEAGGA